MRALTMEEAASEMRVSRRVLQDIVKRHPHYYVNGNRKLFTPADIAAIVTGLRREAQECHSPPSPSLRKGEGECLKRT